MSRNSEEPIVFTGKDLENGQLIPLFKKFLLKKLENCEKLPRNDVKDDREYSFLHEVRGIAIVISNECFELNDGTKIAQRPYAEIELRKMNEMFAGLGYLVMLFKDLTADQMYEVIRTVTSSEMDEVLEKSDSFACVLASHGYEVLEESVANPKVDCKVYYHHIYGTDMPIKTNVFLDLLDEEQCKTLRGKPKLFFVQACRSRFGLGQERFDRGAFITTDHRLKEHSNPRQSCDKPESLSEDSAPQPKEVADGSVDQVKRCPERSDNVHDTDPKSVGDTATNERKDKFGEGVYSENEASHHKKLTTELNNQSSLHDVIPCLDVDIILEETKDVDNFEDPNIIERGKKWIKKRLFKTRYSVARTVHDTDVVTTVATPCHNDFLIMYSTSEGKAGFGRDKMGGWFLSAMHELMVEHINDIRKDPGNRLDFLSVMTSTMNVIGVHYETDTGNPSTSGVKTAPTLQHKLSYDLIFRNKYIEQ